MMIQSRVGRLLLGELLKIKYSKYLKNEYSTDIHPTLVIEALYKHAKYESPWFLNAFLTQSEDAVGCEVLKFIKQKVKKNAVIFETGCGIGTYLLWFYQNGFRNLYGSDILPTLINAANELASKKNWDASFWVDNGLKPTRLPENCDVIIAMRWLFSAWGGNYSHLNKHYHNLDRLVLLRNFIECYSGSVANGGYLIIQLVDKLSDFKVRETGVYPVRHDREEVGSIAEEFGFKIEKIYINWSHQILATYFLKKFI